MTPIYRPLVHFSPPQGWTNDPNGLVWHNGLWHLFYQHNPVALESGQMHWGHAVSRDLAHWEHCPIALPPDELGAIWSGSAAVQLLEDGSEQLVACYTNASERAQVQGLAFSQDGREWRKYGHNPVLTLDRPDFRDPYIFRHGDGWRMVVAAGNEARFYASTNLTEWSLLSTLPAPASDWIWECPSLFEFDGQWVLMASLIVPRSQVADGSNTRYWVGSFDGARFTPLSGPHSLSFGPDDYAAIVWNNAPDNRRVIIGWMSHWSYAGRTPTESEKWRGAMTLPRELTFHAGRLRQLPATELRQLRGAPLRWGGRPCPPATVECEVFEVEVEIDLSGLRSATAGFRLHTGDLESTTLLYDPARGHLTVDRSQSGQVDFHPAFAGSFSAPLAIEGAALKLNIFVDRCSVEVFAQGGMLYGAALIFPTGNKRRVEFIGDGASLMDAAIYPLITG